MHLPSYTTSHFKKHYLHSNRSETSYHNTSSTTYLSSPNFASALYYRTCTYPVWNYTTKNKKPTLRQGANVLIFDGKVWCLSKRGSSGFPLVKQSRQTNSKFMDILTVASCSDTTKHDCQKQNKWIVQVTDMYEQDWYSTRHNRKASNNSIVIKHRIYSS